MKQTNLLFTILCTTILLYSCDNDTTTILEPEVSALSSIDELNSSYELSLEGMSDYKLKGYTEADNKDESTPTQEPETTASQEIINYLKEQVDQLHIEAYSKTARDFPMPASYQVGVFKTTTCGNQKEFKYHMDCMDGGWTNIINPKNRPFATYVDGNGNVEFRMCVVGGYNHSGFALALTPIPDNLLTERQMLIVERYHDNEDSNNKNQVSGDLIPRDNGQLGPSVFNDNTLFSWVEDHGRGVSYDYKYGVIAQDGDIEISIDDENRKNHNWARRIYYISGRDPWSWEDCPYKEWVGGMNLWENTGYRVRIN